MRFIFMKIMCDYLIYPLINILKYFITHLFKKLYLHYVLSIKIDNNLSKNFNNILYD